MEPATPTTRAQRDLETRIASIYRDLADLDATGRVHRVHRGDDALPLQRDRHARYAAAGLGRLPAGFSSLDASRPWIVYWVLHSLALLRAPLPDGIESSDVVAFLSACKAAGGGYGGGPGQMAHLAPTYAAVCALLTLGGDEALASVDRPAVAGFLRRMVVPPERGGGFTMHDGGRMAGEADAGRRGRQGGAVPSSFGVRGPNAAARGWIAKSWALCLLLSPT
jgi:protein farnesyltransferase subunit beta